MIDLRTVYLIKDILRNDIVMVLLVLLVFAENLCLYLAIKAALYKRWQATEEERLPERIKAILRGKKLEIAFLNKKIQRLEDKNEALQERLNGTKAWARTIQHRMSIATSQLVKISEGVK